jgi:hypothetical protein
MQISRANIRGPFAVFTACQIMRHKPRSQEAMICGYLGESHFPKKHLHFFFMFLNFLYNPSSSNSFSQVVPARYAECDK